MQAQTSNNNSLVDSWVGLARRRGWIIVLCVLIAGGGAYAIAKSSTKQYTATSALLFQQSGLSQALFGFSSSVAQDPTTQQATAISLASQPVLALLTSRKLGGKPSFQEIRSQVVVSAANEGEVIDIAVSSDSPALSSRIANVYAEEVIAYQTKVNQAQIYGAARSLRKQIKATAPTNPDVSDLRSRLDQLNALASLQTGGVQIAGTALPPTSASSPRPERDALLGVVLGLVIGLAAAVVIERRDSRIRNMDDVNSAFNGLPILGVIPQAQHTKWPRVTDAGAGAFSEAFRLLRAQLRYFNVDRDLLTILVVSATPGDGKSTVAWNLAATSAMAAGEGRVLLIDADLRRPRVAAISEIAPSVGLSELLTDDAHLDSVIQRVPLGAPGSDGPLLEVIPSGGLPPNPAQLLESKSFKQLLATLSGRYDLVVIDSPPASIVSDAIPLMRLVDGVLVVTRIDHTQSGLADVLAEQLGQLDAPTLGVAVNGVVASRAGSNYGYDENYYSLASGRHVKQARDPEGTLNEHVKPYVE